MTELDRFKDRGNINQNVGFNPDEVEPAQPTSNLEPVNLADLYEVPVTKPNAVEKGVEKLLETMDTASAELLKLCAIPHEFSVEILRVLEPNLTQTQAEQYFGEFANFSFVTLSEKSLRVHDDVRSYLFAKWLNPIFEKEFIDASNRLASYFNQHISKASGIFLEVFQYQYLFHLFGTDQAKGFIEFERLFHQNLMGERFSKCEGLIRLLCEYYSILDTQIALRLLYYSSELMIHAKKLDLAEIILNNIILSKVLTDDLGIKVKESLTIIKAQRFGKLGRSLKNPLMATEDDTSYTKPKPYFCVGDVVVYPNHGPATVQEIITKHIEGNDNHFYQLRLSATNSVVMVPINDAKRVGLRSPIANNDCERLWKTLGDSFHEPPADWKERFKDFSDKMRTGNIFEVAEILKNLNYLSQTKPLSFREKRMLERARFLIVSEVAIVSLTSEREVVEKLDETLQRGIKKYTRVDVHRFA